MFKRILTGVIAFCFVLVPILFFADTVVLPIAVAVFSLIATYELLHCVGLHKNLWVSIPLYLVSAALPFGARMMTLVTVFALPLSLCVILLYLLAVAVFSHGKADIQDVSTAFMLWLYTLLGFFGLIMVHDHIRGGEYLYLLAFLGAWVTDIFAYFTGMLLGRHKLIPAVSPKKTVEGAIGGLLGGLVGAIPMPCLAGVLIMVSYNMSGWRSIRSICHHSRMSAAIMFTTLLLTVIFDLTIAIEVGILMAVVSFMKRIMENTNISVISDETTTAKRPTNASPSRPAPRCTKSTDRSSSVLPTNSTK